MNRRRFLASSVVAALAAPLFSASAGPRRVAIIGHTGRGNYGHKLDVVWKLIPGVEIAGVADADPAGLEKAKTRLGTSNGFSDYREMLKETKPDFVSVCPRHVDQHRDMTLAAIEAGAKGIYVEKPFCRTPAEADEIIQAADRSSTKIAVAHRNRYHPVLKVIDKLITDGAIGRILEIQGYGKGDRRGGSEDLWVLGSHVMNLFHYFGGKPVSCFATILQDGQLAGPEDVVQGAEGLGLMAGNEVRATYHLSSGLLATYKTFTNDGSKGQGYSLHLTGTEGTITIPIDGNPFAWLTRGNPANPESRNHPRIPITTAGPDKEEPDPERIAQVQNHIIPVLDLINAVDQDRQPLCSAKDAALVVEMITGAFASHLQDGARIKFPLTDRGNPWHQFR